MKIRGSHLLIAAVATVMLAGFTVAAADGEDDNDKVVKTGIYKEDVFAAGDDVTVRAQVDGGVIVMGGDVDIRSQVTGDVVAMAGDLKIGDAISGDVIAAGGRVETTGRVDGEVIVMGGSVDLDSAIAGNVLVTAGAVEVQNRIDGDLKVVGGRISAEGAVGGNLMMTGGNVELEDDARIAGNAWAFGGRVEIEGIVGGDLRVAGRRVEIGGEIRGDAHIDALELKILKTAKFLGNVTYRSPNKADIDGDAQFVGDVTFIQSEEPRHAVGAAFATAGGAVLILVLAFILLGAAQVLILPDVSFAAAGTIGGEPWKAIGIGFAMLVAAPFAIVLLMSTVVGIPLGLVLGAIYLVMLALGFVVSGLAVGRKGLSWISRDWGQSAWGRIGIVAVGLFVIAIVALIPFLGVLIVLIAVCVGTGALAVQVVRRRGEANIASAG